MANLKQKYKDVQNVYNASVKEIKKEFAVEMEKLNLSIVIDKDHGYTDEGSQNIYVTYLFVPYSFVEFVLNKNTVNNKEFDELLFSMKEDFDNNITRNLLKSMGLDLDIQKDLDAFNTPWVHDDTDTSIVTFKNGDAIITRTNYSMECDFDLQMYDE